ncbi:hypothetical protein AAG906_022704 [Vitis piasezkii]
MSKVSKATNMPTIPVSKALTTHTQGELSNIQAVYRLSGKNYLYQVLGRDQLPSLNETISMIQAKKEGFQLQNGKANLSKGTTKIFTGVIRKNQAMKRTKQEGEQQSNQSKLIFYYSTGDERSGLRQDDWACKRKGWVVLP